MSLRENICIIMCSIAIFLSIILIVVHIIDIKLKKKIEKECQKSEKEWEERFRFAWEQEMKEERNNKLSNRHRILINRTRDYDEYEKEFTYHRERSYLFSFERLRTPEEYKILKSQMKK